MTNSYNISFSINRAHLLFCMVTLYSLLKNNQNYYFNIYVLHNNCLDDKEIQEVCGKYPLSQFSNFKIHLIDVSNIEVLKSKNEIRKGNCFWGKEILFKLFLQDILTNVDNLLHLDTDVLIRGDIKRLFEANKMSILYKGDSGIKPKWLNAGILFINLELARKLRISEIIIPYLEKNPVTEEQIINNLFVDKVELYDKKLVYSMERLKHKNLVEFNHIAIHYLTQKPFAIKSSWMIHHRKYIFEYYPYLEEFIDPNYKVKFKIMLLMLPLFAIYYSYKRRLSYL